MHWRHQRFVVTFLLAVFSHVIARAEEPVAGTDRNVDLQLRMWVDAYTKIAAQHDFRLAEDHETPLDRQPKALQVYSHPSGLEGTHGAFYVWTRMGRPEVVGSIWSYESKGDRRTIVHEFDSLATTPLAEIQIAKGTWKQRRTIAPELVRDAPLPAALPRARLSQMKEIAHGFEGYSMTNKTEIQLRMLPRPLYQFQSGEGAVRDAALFCFFADWDPEIVLLIESRSTESGDRWYYSAARFNVCPMWLNYHDNQVWRVDREPNTEFTFGDPEGPFFAVHEVGASPRAIKPEKASEPAVER